MPDFTKLEKIDRGVYLKRGKFGHRLVYPYRDEEGTWLWFNVFIGGNWFKFIASVLFILLILGSIAAYKQDVMTVADKINWIAANPCEWCELSRTTNPDYSVLPFDLNWTAELEMMRNRTIKLPNSTGE
ncbi:unnamed protein product [marine sediment metagenome]|uniref:Uncharacterized protein n=1 Tax=marine sediment metagenome TaxID=412755 RepID=X1HEF1_9ZZZZ